MNPATRTADSQSSNLPEAIRRALGALDRRIRRGSAVRGLGTLALVLAPIAAMGMALDFAWPLPWALRWLIWLGWLGASGWLLATKVVRPSLRRGSPLELAAVAEQACPDLGERLTGAVGLLGEPSGRHGSPSLIAATAEDASKHVDAIEPRRIVSLRRPGRRLALGVSALALVVVPSLIWPDTVGRLGRRFLAPWADVARVSRYVVTVAPGDRTVALGDDVAIEASVRDRYGKAGQIEPPSVEWTDEQRVTHRVAMASGNLEEDKPQSFSTTLPRVSGSFAYKVVGGAIESRTYRIEAVEPPRIASLEAKVEPPAYTKFPAFVARDPARVEAWEGSRVTLKISASRPAQAIEVDWPRVKEPVPASLAADHRSGSASAVAEQSGGFSVRIKDEQGLASRAETPRRLVVRLDGPPTLALKGDDKPEESRADDTLRVAGSARDDVAVASVELHYTIERAKGRASASEEGESGHVVAGETWKGLGSASSRGVLELPLKPLRLRPGDKVSYRVRAADNRPAPKGPNVVWSSPRILGIVSQAETLQAKQDRVEREGIQAKLEALKAAASENRKETEQLRYAADAARRGNGAWEQQQQRDLEQREAEARSVADRLQVFAREMAQNAKFRELSRPARQVAEVEAEGGRAMLEKAKGQADASQRLDDLRQADSRLAAVSQRLDALQQQFDGLNRRDGDLQKLSALADREAAIAQDAAAKAGDRAQLDRLQAEQGAVRKDLDNLVKQSPEMRADVLKAQATEAEALARRARQLADRQREEARTATDLSQRAEALKALAEAQRNLEDDARRLALEVDDPLAENWRGRLNVDALREAAGPIERGDLEQARQRLEGAEQELRRVARDLEDLPNDPKALAIRLARRQDELAGPVEEAIREVRDKPEPTAVELAAMVDKLRPLAEAQEAINRLANAIRPPADPQSDAAKSFPQDVARAAVQSTTRASEALRALKPREIQARQEDARREMRRLADALPDAYRRQEPTRQRLGETVRNADDLGRELERHLRETSPQPGQPLDPAKSAEDLANRLAPLVERQDKAAKDIAALAVEPRALPQRDRAARRARTLAESIKTLASKDVPTARRQELRNLLAPAQVEARASLDRLEQKVHDRPSADDVAEELAADQQALAGLAKDPGSRSDAAADQRRLATALRALNVPDAAIPQADAVRAAEAAAKALAEAGTKPDAKVEAEVQKANDAARRLADHLNDRLSSRAKAEALAQAQRALDGAASKSDPVGSARRQRAISEGLASLPREGREVAEEPLRLAAELAERALRPDGDQPGMSKPTPAAVAGSRARAAEALEKFAATLPGNAPATATTKAPGEALPDDPALRLDPKALEGAKKLAQRERRVREQLQSLLGERAEPQQALRQESTALGRELADLRDRSRPVSDRSQGPANEAAQLLGEHAPQAMDQGVEQLLRAQPAQARDAQRRAAEMLERGAQQAEDLAAALRAEASADPNAGQQAQGKGKGQGPSSLDEAREAMRQASSQLEQAREPGQGDQAGRSAQDAMANAAKALRQAASQQAGESDNEQLASDDSPANDPGSAPGPSADPKLSLIHI